MILCVPTNSHGALEIHRSWWCAGHATGRLKIRTAQGCLGYLDRNDAYAFRSRKKGGYLQQVWTRPHKTLIEFLVVQKNEVSATSTTNTTGRIHSVTYSNNQANPREAATRRKKLWNWAALPEIKNASTKHADRRQLQLFEDIPLSDTDTQTHV